MKKNVRIPKVFRSTDSPEELLASLEEFGIVIFADTKTPLVKF